MLTMKSQDYFLLEFQKALKSIFYYHVTINY